MKRILLLIAVICVISFLATKIVAQEPMQPLKSERYLLSQRMRLYDPDTLQTVSGEVLNVTQTSSRSGQGYGVHLWVKTAQETIEVHLGPAWYLDQQNFSIEVGDRLDIQGSRITDAGILIIIANQVKKGEDVLILRDQNGLPVWSRRQR
jgi:hypothetical protein